MLKHLPKIVLSGAALLTSLDNNYKNALMPSYTEDDAQSVAWYGRFRLEAHSTVSR